MLESATKANADAASNLTCMGTSRLSNYRLEHDWGCNLKHSDRFRLAAAHHRGAPAVSGWNFLDGPARPQWSLSEPPVDQQPIIQGNGARHAHIDRESRRD